MVPEESLVELCRDVSVSWARHVTHATQDNEREKLVGLPHPYVTPTPGGGGIFTDMQYYWDTYFIILGLTRQRHLALARGMVDNLAHLFRRFGVIPPANRFYYTGMSQPPLLTAMIEQITRVYPDSSWEDSIFRVAEDEYESYWMRGESANDPVYHFVKELGGNRYCDVHLTHPTAEDESGWDYTWRFDERCMNVLPVDLNAFLYRYELDIAAWHRRRGANNTATMWEAAAARRRQMMNEYMWDDSAGFFFDYDFFDRRRLTHMTLAGFAPLWAGAATSEQAERVIGNALPTMEHAWGLANTEPIPRAPFKQWDYPNGWPNLQWLALEGMWKYGHQPIVRRLADKWVALNAEVRDATGFLWEKYDVVNGHVGRSAGYPTQRDFGWTLGVLVAVIEDFLRSG